MSSRDQRVVADTPQRSATSASNATQFGLRATSEIKDIHLNRLAIVYVRQSSPQQVMENRESRERQYALAEFAKRLGWTFERIIVIDEDQGLSGKSADNRARISAVDGRSQPQSCWHCTRAGTQSTVTVK